MSDISSILKRIEDLRRNLDDLETQVRGMVCTDQSVDAVEPALYGCSASKGLHSDNLPSNWARIGFLKEQANHLRLNLREAIPATRKAAPQRKRQGFRLLNPTGRVNGDDMAAGLEERLLESRLFQQWGLPRWVRTPDRGVTQISNLWKAIAGVQVPLFDARRRRGWGHIDLVAIGEDSLPIVVELKAASNRESILRPILEGVSYTLALEAVWSAFQSEYSELLQGYGLTVGDQWDTKPKQIAIMAPVTYWKFWREPRNGWPEFRALTGALKDAGYLLSFLQCPDLGDDGKLVRDETIIPVEGPWNKP